MKNPYLVYQAKSFYNAYHVLQQVTFDSDELLLVAPKFVYGSFAVELTIKAILVEQDIPYNNEHNLKLLFDMLPLNIQERVWSYLSTKFPEYSDIDKCQTELLIMSEAFVQWRYYYESNSAAPSFDGRFLAAFANAMIFVMFDLGYNTFFTKSEAIPPFTEKYAEIDKKFEENRKEYIEKNRDIIQKKQRKKQ